MLVSIIVPFYNEERRMLNFLKDLLSFSKNYKENHEIIFVDDGSTDNTLEILKKNKRKNVRIISYKPNMGKGYAVKKGVENSKGDKILFIDADGSISPDQIPNMVKELNNYDVVVGTRYSKKADVKQPVIRLFLGTIFNLYVNMLYDIHIYDNLCGFKGFKRKSAKVLFSKLKSNRWIFDIELFYRIRKNNLDLYEMPIRWEHRGESKIKLFDPLKMMWNLLKLRIELRKERD